MTSVLTMTNGAEHTVTSEGAWYMVRAININSGVCAAYIIRLSDGEYISASQSPDGEYKRATTAWIYFPQGVQFRARALFIGNGDVFKALPLS